MPPLVPAGCHLDNEVDENRCPRPTVNCTLRRPQGIVLRSPVDNVDVCAGVQCTGDTLCTPHDDGYCCVHTGNYTGSAHTKSTTCTSACVDASSECARTTAGTSFCRPHTRAHVCRLPIDQGFMACAIAARQQWAYVPEVGACRQFAFYGCRQGNANRFNSERDCATYCNGVNACAPPPTLVDSQSGHNTTLCHVRWFTDESGCPMNKLICDSQ
jgi:hypothetical protein